MILSNRANEEIVNKTLNGNNVARITSHDFLGVMFEETLKFNVHINKVQDASKVPGLRKK